ncbi:Zinc finger FYVE domain-containing protein 26 [Linnemannia exigua]|uniref:Zinc finger FYVE domain-containing protein 26 n=1 Tax=Linnemannia exigua TaxID=604196 RepID=A0AAD4HCG0_9FUNG|nr:Zinc finger FYVE domain-containing protein 26 [Linnemannia exigua]
MNDTTPIQALSSLSSSPPLTITTTEAAIREPSSTSGTARAGMSSKPMSISTKAIFTTTATATATTALNHDDQPSSSSSSASVSSPSSSNSPGSLSPITPAKMHARPDALLPLSPAAMVSTPPLSAQDDVVTSCAQQKQEVAFDHDNNNKDDVSSDSETLEAVTATLHKKDSGTSMGSSVVSSPIDSRPPSQTALPTAADPDDSNSSCATSPIDPAPVLAGTQKLSQTDTGSSMSPAGRVLTRPLSTSKLSSIPLTAPHILPNQRYAGFNLAAFGQLSPSTATAAAMTISRADSLAFLNSTGSSPNPYFGISAAAMKGGSSTPNSLMEGIMLPSGASKTMCGSDAISLLDLDDSHNDIVMIDSNGNSSGSSVVGPATVVETMASASAFVSSNHASSSHHTTLGGAASGLAAGLGLTAAVSSGINGSSSSSSASGGIGGGGGGGSSGLTFGSGSGMGSGSSSGSSISQPRSSLPSLTSQAKRDAMQRAAMLAAIQQNRGAKILGAHRRQDRPSRKIRFGEFHKICEIEQGFDQGKPLVANGRTLVHSTSVLRISGDEEREEQLYLFSDVLVTGTKIRKGNSKFTKSVPEVPTVIASGDAVAEEAAQDPVADSDNPSEASKKDSVATTDVEVMASLDNSKLEVAASALETKKEQTAVEVSVIEILDNPYAGHLENQQISRLTQVQADVIEGEEQPKLKLSVPQSTSLLIFTSTATRDSFMTLLTETIYAHKHYLLSQSKYLADLKKFKRHSAFSFDTSFLKTWGIPGGLNLGSLKPAGGAGGSSGHGTIGPNTFISSPVASPGGSAFEPYQYQHHISRPQSMASSLFGLALNGGHFQPFSDHSKENSYATLRGANAAHALQYHHQQQQMLQQQLQNRLSMSSVTSGRTGMDRTSSGSTFDALWFMKGGETVKSRRSVVHTPDDERDGDVPVDDEGLANTLAGDATVAATQPDSSSSAGSPSLTVNTGNVDTKSSSGRPSGSSVSRPLLSTSSSFNSIATLRNGAGWVRDEDASYCMVCTTTKFGVLIRKHHCRLCGRVICWKCCQMKDAVLLNNVLADQGHSPAEVAAISQEFRKPIRVCLDCIEQNASDSQHSQPTSPQQQQAPSPLSGAFPLQGVFGKLMSSTMSSSPQIVASATNAVGSSTFASPSSLHPVAPFQQQQQQQQRGQGSTPSSFYPRIMNYSRGGNPYPHHHRASLYRIDVERVGEEDEEEDEEESAEEEQEVGELLQKADEALVCLTQEPNLQDQAQEHETPETDATHLTVDNNTANAARSTIKSGHGSVRLKDLDPADINEEEVNNQIMNLESEVESLLIQSAVATPLMFSRPTGRGGEGSSRHQREGGTGAGKTRVIRGIPKEMMLQSQQFYAGGDKDVVDEGEDGDEEDEDDEEVSMEELLAQQDERLKRILS